MSKRIIGVDVGGTSAKLATVEIDDVPRVVTQDQWFDHQDLTPTEAIPVLKEMCTQLMEEAGWDSLDALGVGLAGLVETHLGILKRAPNLQAWEEFPFVPALEEAFQCPVRVANDATAFAMAEWQWGAGRETQNAVFLTLGTGIGGGLVTEGRLVLGDTGLAGEPGHIILDRNGLACSCGNVGCAEMYIGREAVLRAAREHPGFGADHRLSHADPLTPALLFEEAEAGNPLAAAVWKLVGEALGDLLVTLTNLLNPQRIIIGGGLSGAGEWIVDPARARLEERSLVADISPPEVVTATLGSQAGVIGAAGMWAQKEFIHVR